MKRGSTMNNSETCSNDFNNIILGLTLRNESLGLELENSWVSTYPRQA